MGIRSSQLTKTPARSNSIANFSTSNSSYHDVHNSNQSSALMPQLSLFPQLRIIDQAPFIPKDLLYRAFVHPQHRILVVQLSTPLSAAGFFYALRYGPFQARGPRKAPGRSVSLHSAEQWRQELRERQQSPEGRAKRRARVAVAPALAPVGRWQSRRARYRGRRHNLCEVRRAAVIHHVPGIARTAAATHDVAA
jgi:hypothetical protein